MHQFEKHRSNASLYGSSLILASTLFYGSYGVWTRLMGGSFGPFMQSWIRATIVVLALLLPFLFGKQKWVRIRWREEKWWFIVWSLASWLIGPPLYYAINRLGIGVGILIFYAGYLIGMFLLGRLLGGERYDRSKLVATVLAMSGLYLTSAPTFHSAALLPFIAAIAAGFGVALDMVIAQKIRYDSTQTTLLAWATGIVVTAPTAFLLHEQVPSLSNIHWLYLLAFVAANIAASWLSTHGVKRIEAGVAGILGLLEIVWAVLFGIVFFHERPHWSVYAGVLCIVSAAAIPYIGTLKKNKSAIIEELPA